MRYPSDANPNQHAQSANRATYDTSTDLPIFKTSSQTPAAGPSDTHAGKCQIQLPEWMVHGQVEFEPSEQQQLALLELRFLKALQHQSTSITINTIKHTCLSVCLLSLCWLSMCLLSNNGSQRALCVCVHSFCCLLMCALSFGSRSSSTQENVVLSRQRSSWH